MQIYTWPDDFDFQSDETCQNVFKPFIERQIKALEDYDALRLPGHSYIFHEHAARVADDVRRTCLHMGLGETVAQNMYWAVLPHDIGKCALPVEIWDVEDKPSEALKAQRRTHTTLGVEMVRRALPETQKHPFQALMCDIMRLHHEQMDGKGTHNVPGERLSAPVRLAAIVEAYDGWSIKRPHFGERDISPAGVIKRMREEKGAAVFDMTLLEAFAGMKLGDQG